MIVCENGVRRNATQQEEEELLEKQKRHDKVKAKEDKDKEDKAALQNTMKQKFLSLGFTPEEIDLIL